MNQNATRLSLNDGSWCSVYSRSAKKWYDGVIKQIYIDPTTNKEWLIIKYGKNKTKKMQRLCKDLKFKASKLCENESSSNKITKRSANSASNKLVHMIESEWLSLQIPCFNTTLYSNIVAINEIEYVLATDMKETEPFGGVYKYNVISNQWRCFLSYHHCFPFKRGSRLCITFNNETDELYILGQNRYEFCVPSVLVQINIKTRNFKVTNWEYRIENNVSILIINGELHVIGSEVDESHHLIFSDACNPHAYDNKHHIWKTSNNMFAINDHLHHRAIYVKSKNKLFVFGGYHDSSWRYLGTNGAFVNDIYCFALDTRDKWTKLQIGLPKKVSLFGCVMTTDEKYIIIIGGLHEILVLKKRKVHDIFVLDLETFMFYKSSLQCPEPEKPKDMNTMIQMHEIMDIDGAFTAVLLPLHCSHILIYGYAQNVVFREEELVIPNELIHLIAMYFFTEYIYLMEIGKMRPQQWKICVDHILNAMRPVKLCAPQIN